MRIGRWLALTLITTAALGWKPRNATTTEADRLRAHFDSVNLELVSTTTAGLSESQRISRARLVAWLRDYRNAGRFPQNDRFPGRAVPFFRDSRGVLCAM